MLTRRLFALAAFSAGASTAWAQQAEIEDGLYLVVDDEYALNVFRLPHRGRDVRLIVGRSPLMRFEVSSAVAEIDEIFELPIIRIVLTETATAEFARISAKYLGRQLALVRNGEVLTAPNINEPINGGQLQISGALDVDEARALAALIAGGAAAN